MLTVRWQKTSLSGLSGDTISVIFMNPLAVVIDSMCFVVVFTHKPSRY